MDRRLFLTSLAAAGLGLATTARADGVLLRELYNKDKSFSDLALSLAGQRIEVGGYMAPPLKAETNFYVLTRRPMATCPFCETEAQWPTDIVAVYARDLIVPIPFNVPMLTTGVLELGTYTDPDLGFVSRVRLTDARFDRA
ncbi:hypothetical protein SAMN04488003_10230 [Loktanella fryxellensis]|uniref:Uncharacterized protein n=1 Tax=Loktanella fryxellensis TaxID=245187 RepID=A0A1H7ZKJ3_9RHOB|nr:hypothetical protein [Loktanella fryxellensis]SEM59102.1 hypothetical protein SAMN04488003_10230 [Loktanella fryxellensis]